MALKGQAKTDYQREYMRRRRSNARSNRSNEGISPFVRPQYVRPLESDTLQQPSEFEVVDDFATGDIAETQSYNPMMVGYIPPK